MKGKRKWMMLLLALGVFCTTINMNIPVVAEEGDITTGLVAHYDFEGISGDAVKDATGNGYDAKLVGGELAAGKLDGAIYLNSTKGVAYKEAYGEDVNISRLEIPTGALAATEDVTIALLLKADTDNVNTLLMSFGDWENSNDNNARFMYFWLCHHTVNAGAHMAIQAPGAARNHIKADTDDYIEWDDNWYWYVFTLSGEDVTLSIDGYVVAEGESRSDLGSLLQTELTNGASGNNIVSLGTSSVFNGDDSFAGWIDDVRIYNRALTSADIKILMALGNPTSTEDPVGTEEPAGMETPDTPTDPESPTVIQEETATPAPTVKATQKSTATATTSTQTASAAPGEANTQGNGSPWIIVIVIVVVAAVGGVAYYLFVIKKKK